MISSGVWRRAAVWLLHAALCGGFGGAVLAGTAATAHAQSLLAFKYTPAPRAQLAIWIEDAAGQFLATVALTEAVGYRGIGNRPGASAMNSGYRWPYGRREGVLPIWAHRRASAPGAQLFPRVVFQNRIEGYASRTISDQSPDSYYCLQFDQAKATRDQLDAVSCATPFSSDKGRYLTERDVAAGYSEPYEAMPGSGSKLPLGARSFYPPRMDVERCTDNACYDHADVARFADDARAVMPEIDAVTIATPPGDAQQNLLFSVPKTWPSGDYVAFIEVNTEGDYNAAWNDKTFPTPKTPADGWDYYALYYGYAYRGQPSLVWKVAFHLSPNGSVRAAATQPVGRGSWDVSRTKYGELEPMSVDMAQPFAISADVEHSGVQRLRANADGERFVVESRQGATAPARPKPTEPTEPKPQPDAGVDAGGTGSQPGAAGAGGAADEGGAGGSSGSSAPAAMSGEAGQEAEPDAPTDTPETAPVAPGPVSGLELKLHPDELHSHAWVLLRMRAVRSELPLHMYEVRVATEPIRDETSFIRNGRQAKNATDAAEGATSLRLPTDAREGSWIEATIGDLSPETHYYVGVRAVDEANQKGPIAVAEIATPKRTFATVTPCFVASVAYGSPLADEVSVLRRLRDRYLLPHPLGRAAVTAYYRAGARAAEWVRPHPQLREGLRLLLTPLVGLARALD